MCTINIYVYVYIYGYCTMNLTHFPPNCRSEEKEGGRVIKGEGQNQRGGGGVKAYIFRNNNFCKLHDSTFKCFFKKKKKI